MYNKIVAAFDGSEGSMKALEHAIGLAKSNHAQLAVVHVEKGERRDPHNSLKSGSDMSVNYGGADVKAYEGDVNEIDFSPSDLKAKHSDHEIFSEAKKRASQEGVSVFYEVLKGEPVKRICKYASANDADVIVIGSRGVSGIKKFMLGSISEKVAKEADVPVTIIK
ncbi:universal stress protein [Halobacillus sp. BBL2006]|uniref:universal stress protein n=1 Tax=Halobacillus sp. BBL2006 TaxID=1543706 RepID=UPI0005443D6B|nr:universal stress protein [Halobacillus sp. BBL2006]KHE66974.1 hypothetical protein LD39_19950 [Halobacillus sp. BBL2006]